MPDLSLAVDRYLDAAIDDLSTLVSFPTVAADEREDMADCIAFLEERLAELGGKVEILTLPGARPLIYAEVPGRTERSMMFYQHYDVQPAGARQLWTSDPFRLTEDDGYLFGRGVADNKGNLAARLAALRILKESEEGLPLTIRFLIEGEEEIGSPNLTKYLQRYDDLFHADGCLWEGGYRDSAGRPVLSLGIKGMCKLIVRTRGPERDLHGKFAPIAANPALQLISAIHALAESDGTVQAPGYYDPVRLPNEKESEWLDYASLDLQLLQQEIGLGEGLIGDGRTAIERLLFFSGCNVDGISSGAIGTEARSIVPEKAEALLSFRLVPDQDPEMVFRQIQTHLQNAGFINVEVTFVSGVQPARTPPDHPLVEAAIEATEMVYRQKPVVWPMSPGTGPMSTVCHTRGMAAVAMGVGHAGSNTHAPDENIRLADYRDGIALVATLMRQFATQIDVSAT